MATLLDTNVNSGVAVDLQADKIAVTIEVFASGNEEIPHQSTAEASGYGTEPSDWKTRLSKSQYTGYGNPKIILTGMYDRTISHATNATNNDVDYQFLQSFIASSATKTLTDSELFPSARTVVMRNVNIKKVASNMVTFTIEFMEVNS